MPWTWELHTGETYPPMLFTLDDERVQVDLSHPDCAVTMTAVHSVTGAVAIDGQPCEITDVDAREISYDLAANGTIDVPGNYLVQFLVDKSGDGQDIQPIPSMGAGVIHVEAFP